MGGHQLVEGAVRMNPTKAMLEDIELPGIITDNPQVFRDAVVEYAAQKGALGGYLAMSMIDDRQPLQMRLPGGEIGKDLLVVRG